MLEDLHAHAGVEPRFPSGARFALELARGDEVLQVEVSGPLVLDDSGLMVPTAAGWPSSTRMVADHIAGGQLSRVLEDWCPVLPHFVLYYPGRRQVPAPLRAFIELARAKPE